MSVAAAKRAKAPSTAAAAMTMPQVAIATASTRALSSRTRRISLRTFVLFNGAVGADMDTPFGRD
jgi:hypothetical protein